MEAEDRLTNTVYITLLIDSLKKKFKILEQLYEITKQQEGIIHAEKFSDERFMMTVSLKEEQLELLMQVDQGFEQLYHKIREELSSDPSRYKLEITNLQEYITRLTDLSVKLQALENRNKAGIELLFVQKKKEIKNARLNNKSVINYYQTMEKYHREQSFFYDKKK